MALSKFYSQSEAVFCFTALKSVNYILTPSSCNYLTIFTIYCAKLFAFMGVCRETGEFTKSTCMSS